MRLRCFTFSLGLSSRRYSSFRSWQIEWIFIMKWKFLFISLSRPAPLVEIVLWRSARETECKMYCGLVCNKSADLSISTRIPYLRPSWLLKADDGSQSNLPTPHRFHFNFNSFNQQLRAIFYRNESEFPTRSVFISPASSATVWTMNFFPFSAPAVT